MVSRLPAGQHRVITEESNLPCAYTLAIWSPEPGCMDGQSLLIIGKMLGHSQPATTARYAHLANDPVRAASEAVGRYIASAMENGTSDGVVAFARSRKDRFLGVCS